MSNNYFSFKQFTVWQSDCALKVCTEACLFGAWASHQLTSNPPTTILDIGTGTGLLSLQLAQKLPNAFIDAVELDPAAAAQAAQNAAATTFYIQVHNADIKNYAGKKYQHIISNPPFFENDLKSELALKNQAMHSTTLTLQTLFTCVDDLLEPAGSFSLLLPYARANEAAALAQAHGFHVTHKAVVQQTPNHAPFRVMYIFGKSGIINMDASETTIVIKENEHYTPAFTSYLKDYYLFL
jgi:tRNA1Val (adenine37-N6)-methyltransferase